MSSWRAFATLGISLETTAGATMAPLAFEDPGVISSSMNTVAEAAEYVSTPQRLVASTMESGSLLASSLSLISREHAIAALRDSMAKVVSSLEDGWLQSSTGG